MLTYALALIIGIALGMLGGGGSILTVPVFTYVAGLDPKVAIASSLPVIAVTSAVGAFGHWRARNVQVQATLPNPGGRLRPGMFVQTQVTLGPARQVITLPARIATCASP